MATLATDGTGNRIIQVTGADGKRRPIRLGKLNKKAAEAVRQKVNHIEDSLAHGLPLDAETQAWVNALGDELHKKLAATGLAKPRQSQALGAFLGDYLGRRRLDSKGTNVAGINQAAVDMVNFYGASAPVRSITPAEADRLVVHYRGRGLAAATVSRRLKRCRQAFDYAVLNGLTDANPFARVKVPGGKPDPRRQVYVTRGDARKLIEVCSPDWQLVVALSRFAGLRAPSEVLSLEWSGVDWGEWADGGALAEDRTPRRRRLPRGADLPGPEAAP